MNISEKKLCAQHNEWHDVGDFAIDRSQDDGLVASCRRAKKEGRQARERCGSTMTLDDLRRIIEKVDPSACIKWAGAKTSRHYASMGGFGQNKSVHRVVFEWWHGRPIKPKHQIDHMCCNKLCFNPFHLQELTHAEHAKVTAERRRASRHPKPVTPSE